jgi:hypothetical protein
LKAKLIKILPYATQINEKRLKTRLHIFGLKSRFFHSLVYYGRKAEICPFESESYRPREQSATARHWVEKPDHSTLMRGAGCQNHAEIGGSSLPNLARIKIIFHDGT